MKKMIFVVSCAVMVIAGVLGVNKFDTNELASNDLLMENVEALTRGETENANDEIECKKQGGIWGRASICADGGIETVTCNKKGEIRVMGITLLGSYENGKTYIIGWERYTCESNKGSCCVKQGVFVSEHKI